MIPNDQLALWVQGNSIHNLERNECTPDFSCCCQKLKWPKEVREKFANSSSDVRDTMLVSSLYAAVDEMGGITTKERAQLHQAVGEL